VQQELKILRWAESLNTLHETEHHIAAKVIDILANFGVNVNQLILQHDSSPLYYAICNCHIKTLKFLIKQGAKVNANPLCHSNFEPLLMLACKKGNLENTKILIKVMVDTNLFR
jgi:ankyrin repeat protein